jgi:hypothetical protein
LTQLSLLPTPRVDVYLACPQCGYVWLAAIQQPWIKWLEEGAAEKVARRCYCVACDEKPPMRVAKVQKASAA